MSFLGIDIGTSSVKVTHIEVDQTIKILQSQTIAYNDKRTPTHNPYLWWEKTQQALQQITDKDHIQAIGMTGQMHSLIMGDNKGNIIMPIRLWFDMDGHHALKNFTQTIPDFHKNMGNLPLADFTLAKWLFAKSENKKLIQKVASFYCAKDFIRLQMNPDAAYFIDYNEAVGMQLLHPFARIWDKKLCHDVQIDTQKLPHIVKSRTLGGYTSSTQGLKDHIPIIVGSGDQATAARAVGSFKPGIASLSLGTSGVISIPVRKSDFSIDKIKGFHLFPMGFDDMYQIIGTIPALGETLLWLSRFLNKDLHEIDKIARTHPFDVSCVFSPYLKGKGSPHPDNKKRASLQNLGIESSIEDLIQSVYNGLSWEFCRIIQHIQSQNIPIDKIVVSGGATAFPALIERININLDTEVVLAENADTSAIGAALLAFDYLYPNQYICLKHQNIS